MQYLLTEEEFKNSVPASIVEPFVKALTDYYDRKNQHLMKCIQEQRGDFRSLNPLDDAVHYHRQKWTEKLPEAKDFIK